MLNYINEFLKKTDFVFEPYLLNPYTFSYSFAARKHW